MLGFSATLGRVHPFPGPAGAFLYGLRGFPGNELWNGLSMRGLSYKMTLRLGL
jgi:hypothetical protein